MCQLTFLWKNIFRWRNLNYVVFQSLIPFFSPKMSFAFFNSTIILCPFAMFFHERKSYKVSRAKVERKNIYSIKTQRGGGGWGSFLTLYSPILYQTEFKNLPVVANFPSFSLPSISVSFFLKYLLCYKIHNPCQ